MSKIVNLDDYRPEIVQKRNKKTARPNFVTRHRIKRIAACQKQLEKLLVEQVISEIHARYPKLRKNKPVHFNALVGKVVAVFFKKRAKKYEESFAKNK